MKQFILSAYLAVLLQSFGVLATTAGNNKNRVMVWICLEFCDETQQQIAAEMLEIDNHKDVITAVSFEKYTLGPNSTLVDNHLTPVADKIVSMNLESWPLLSSFPHPPEFIDWMRTVFANPQPFIDSCVSAAKEFKYTGYNLDWEPTDAVTAEDGTNYANFIGTFADSLHKEGLLLSVDVATWSPIWNYTAIAATSADYVISMGTYTATDTSFSSQLDKIMVFGNRAGVGLETVNATTEERLPLSEVQWRFQQMKLAGAKEVDLWSLPVPPLWWPILKDFSTYESK